MSVLWNSGDDLSLVPTPTLVNLDSSNTDPFFFHYPTGWLHPHPIPMSIQIPTSYLASTPWICFFGQVPFFLVRHLPNLTGPMAVITIWLATTVFCDSVTWQIIGAVSSSLLLSSSFHTSLATFSSQFSLEIPMTHQCWNHPILLTLLSLSSQIGPEFDSRLGR